MQLKIGGNEGLVFICNFILVEPGLKIVVTCLRSCSKEGFKAVNICIANTSSEM